MFEVVEDRQNKILAAVANAITRGKAEEKAKDIEESMKGMQLYDDRYVMALTIPDGMSKEAFGKLVDDAVEAHKNPVLETEIVIDGKTWTLEKLANTIRSLNGQIARKAESNRQLAHDLNRCKSMLAGISSGRKGRNEAYDLMLDLNRVRTDVRWSDETKLEANKARQFRQEYQADFSEPLPPADKYNKTDPTNFVDNRLRDVLLLLQQAADDKLDSHSIYIPMAIMRNHPGLVPDRGPLAYLYEMMYRWEKVSFTKAVAKSWYNTTIMRWPGECMDALGDKLLCSATHGSSTA